MFLLRYHLAYEGSSTLGLDRLPHGHDWLESLETLPASTRHFAVHDQHTVGINEHDRAFLERHPEAFDEFVDRAVLTPRQLVSHLERLVAMGVTHANGPAVAGPHWEWATRMFAKACGL